MIKRENIKQAIDAIAKRDPEVGYALDEMLGMGQIDIPHQIQDPPGQDASYFFFDKQKVYFNKFVFIHEGTAPIEQGLLIKYGELLKKQELLDQRGEVNYQDAAREIHKAGLRFMVAHEIELAIKTLSPSVSKGTSAYEPLASLLEEIRHGSQKPESPGEGTDSQVLFRGLLENSVHGLFMQFPYTIDGLMQVGDINIEFFHVRFLLRCLVQGLGKNLFVCVVGEKIVGLIFVGFRTEIFYKGLEIKFMSTLGGRTREETESGPRSYKGAGTFLVAGIWMLWKTRWLDIKEIFLDSEIGARRFYELNGFESRGLSKYTLRHPTGYLFKAVMTMANNIRHLEPRFVSEAEGILRRQVKSLSKRVKDNREEALRKAVILSIKECLKSEAHPEFSAAAVSCLIKYRKKIPDSEELIQFALEYGSSETKAVVKNASLTDH
jgi:hypothetical protein